MLQEDDDFLNGKIYCANCINCKLVPVKSGPEDRYALRIRCAAGKWKKKLGEEKFYKYSTIFRRCADSCDAYDAMGDSREYLEDLKRSVSVREEVQQAGAEGA